MGDYGRKEGHDLAGLLQELAAVPGLERLRVSSIEPNLLTDELLELFVANSVLCPHFHLPLQSGDDRILRLMRRRYTTADYAERVARIREKLPEAGIGVDVIVGFPGESDDAFREHPQVPGGSAGVVPARLHLFRAAQHPGALVCRTRWSPGSGSPRNDALRLLGQRKKLAFLRSLVGTRQQVLAEEEHQDGLRFGFTGSYARVALPAAETSGNTMVDVEITGMEGEHCVGRPIGGAA